MPRVDQHVVCIPYHGISFTMCQNLRNIQFLWCSVPVQRVFFRNTANIPAVCVTSKNTEEGSFSIIKLFNPH